MRLINGENKSRITGEGISRRGGAQHALLGQFLVDSIKNREEEADRQEATAVRQYAPPTCSNFHLLSHTMRGFPSKLAKIR